MTEQDETGAELTTWEIRRKRIVAEALAELAEQLGIEPDEIKSEFKELRKDLAFARRFRRASEDVGAKIIASLVGALTTGAIAWVAIMLKDYFK